MGKKMLTLNKVFLNNKSVLSPTDKLFYRYNVLYGSQSPNIIRTYSPKLRPRSASVSEYIKTISGPHVDDCVFSDEDIILLFESKCKDIQVEPKQELHSRFSEFVKKKCVNRIINLSECNFGFNSIKTICDFIEKYSNKVSRLILARNNIGDKGVEVVTNMLEDNDYILHLDLSSNDIGVKGGNKIFKTLIHHQSLISLNISSLEGVNRNRISSEGAKLIEDVLKTNHFLEYLNVSGNSIKNEGVKYIMSGLDNNPTLKYLDISKNEIDEKGAENIMLFLHQSHLLTLNISSNPIKNEGLLYIANALITKALFFLNSIDLSECKLTFEGLRSFLKKVNYNQKLNAIHLNRNNFYARGFDELETVISPMNLRILSLSSCGIGKYSIGVASLLLANSTLHSIDLSNNQIDDRTFNSFVTIPRDNHSLRHLDFSRNFISDISGKTFIKNLVYNYSIKSLNFFDNQMQNVSANAIVAALQANKTLLKINVECNRIQLKMINEIKSFLKRNLDISKSKYLPKLKSQINSLRFDPREIGEKKRKIMEQAKERLNMQKKLDEEIKGYNESREEMLKSLKDIEIDNEKVLKEIEEYNNKLNDLLLQRNKANDEFKAKENNIKDMISSCEDELEELNKEKEKYIEEQKTMISEYEKSINDTEQEVKKSADKIYLSEISLKNKKDEFADKTAKLEKLTHPPEKERTNSRNMSTKEKKKKMKRKAGVNPLMRKASLKPNQLSNNLNKINDNLVKLSIDTKSSKKEKKKTRPASKSVKVIKKSQSALNIKSTNIVSIAPKSPKNDNSDIIDNTSGINNNQK